MLLPYLWHDNCKQRESKKGNSNHIHTAWKLQCYSRICGMTVATNVEVTQEIPDFVYHNNPHSRAAEFKQYWSIPNMQQHLLHHTSNLSCYISHMQYMDITQKTYGLKKVSFNFATDMVQSNKICSLVYGISICERVKILKEPQEWRTFESKSWDDLEICVYICSYL